MDFEIDTRKLYNTLVKWTVSLPRIHTTVVSKSFGVYDYNWTLELAASEGWSWTYAKLSMTLYFSDEKNPTWFPLSVYIRNKGEYLCLSKHVISKKRTEIWSSCGSDFRKKCPFIEVDGTLLQFVIQFHTGIQNPRNPIYVEKSVQTPDPNTDTKYPENHPCLENLSLDMSNLMEDGTDTDVQLKCGNVSIGAHKLILGARSEVFRSMLQSDMVEGHEGIVQIIDMEPKILKIFIRYIYTGNLPEISMDTALPIYEAADKYQVEALKKRSSEILVKNLSPENVLAILVAADAHSDSDLKRQLVPYIIEKKIPSREVEWLKFCNDSPKLANEVLNRMIK